MRRRSGGQTLALFALVTPVMLAIVALGLDAAQAFVERRDAQAAADLSSLAGALYLHDDVTEVEQQQARDAALAVALANGYVASRVTVTTPQDGDPERIEVIIDSEVDTFFKPILGLFVGGDHSIMDVDARAVAYGGYEEVYGDAIFAAESDCDGDPRSVLSWPANNVVINGGIHSNSGIAVSGNNNRGTGGTTYGCIGEADFYDPGSGNVFDPPAYSTNSQADWPVTYTLAQFDCSGSGPESFVDLTTGEWNLGQGGGLAWWLGGAVNGNDPPTLMPGTYCAPNGSIKLDANNVVGTVTFVAKEKVTLSGQNLTLEPHENGVLIFSLGTGSQAVSVSTEGGTWEGLIYAPNGTASIRGQSGFQLNGGIHAWNVALDGNGFSITNDGGGPGAQQYALIE